MKERVLAIYPSHDSSITVYNSNGDFRVFELERLKNERFYRFDNKDDFKETYDTLKNIISDQCGEESFDVCYHQNLPDTHIEYMKRVWGIKRFEFVGHHIAHAASSFYQSNYDEALIISYDGGGFEGHDAGHRVSFFNFYIGNRKNGIKRIHTVDLDLGTGYGMIAIPISEINKSAGNWQSKFLGFAGKLMGLSAYGNVRKEWKPAVEKFYRKVKQHDPPRDLKDLGKTIGLNLSYNTIGGQDSYDLAATAQSVFRDMVFKEILPFISKYNLPVCLSGGCALNILVNQEIYDTVTKDLYIPPNPSDCGLSFGMAALHIKPQEAVELMYSGFPILDFDMINKLGISPTYINDATKELSLLLNDGKIIGVVQGNSEHGPRALGNRSILCDPSFVDMKDTLNAKVKFREWFRPFAPIVRVEDVSKHFDFNGTSKYMSYSPKSLNESIPSVVHIDGTSRIQTIDKNDNPLIYNLLTEFSNKYGKEVLLNTSFNIKGLPILTRIKDAIKILRTTKLDYVFVATDDDSGYLFK